MVLTQVVVNRGLRQREGEDSRRRGHKGRNGGKLRRDEGEGRKSNKKIDTAT